MPLGSVLAVLNLGFFVSGNCKASLAKVIATRGGSSLINNLGNYLGVPLVHGRTSEHIYKDIQNKMQQKLATWKSSQLSLAGRIVLIKSITSTIPIYAMQSIKLPIQLCDSLDRISRNFLWNQIDDKKTIHLYVRNKNVDELCNKNATNCSSTWRGIAHGIKLLLEGVVWRVGNGRLVNFWLDRWVPGLDTLSDYALYPVDQSNNNEKVSSFNENGSWSLFKLRAVVPWNIIQRIVSIHINGIGNGVDSRIWGSDSEGNFTVKSTYDDFFEGNLSEQWKFDLVWKIKIPPKVQCFLWLAV
ncbi:hypothetical protein ACOSQ2_032976 [Xanthoceras sorbifolium]